MFDDIMQKIKELAHKIDMLTLRVTKLEEKQHGTHTIPEKSNIDVPQQTESALPAESPAREPLDWKKIESRIGNYWMQILGVILFVIGIGFFIKYAIEQELISPTVRIIIGLLAATVLLGIGEYITKKTTAWAIACIAGSIALYYGSIYAAYALYSLIGQTPAFLGFVIVTVIALSLAMLHDAQIIALFGLIGGFVTPLFFDLWPETPYFAFAYYTLITLSFLVPSTIKSWGATALCITIASFAVPHVLSPDLYIAYYALIAIALLIASWIRSWYHVAIASVFLYQIAWPYSCQLQITYQLVFLFIYVMLPVLYLLIMNPAQRLFEPLLIGIAGCLSFFTVTSAIITTEVDRMPFFICWLLSGISIMPPAKELIFARLGFIFGCVYALLTILMILRNKTARLCHAVLFSLAIIFLSTALMIYTAERVVPTSFICNEINAIIVLLTLLCAGAAYYITNNKQALPAQAGSMVQLLVEYGALLFIAWWFNTGVWQSCFYATGISLIYSGLLIIFGLYLPRSPWRFFGYGYFLITWIVFIFIFGGSRQLLLWHIIILCAISAAIAYISLYSMKKEQIKTALSEIEKKYGADVMRTLTVFFIWLAGHEIIRYTSTTQDTQNIRMAVYYGVYLIILITVGLVRRRPILRYMGFVLAIITLGLLWSIIMRLSTPYERTIAFVATGIALMIVSFIYQYLAKKIEPT